MNNFFLIPNNYPHLLSCCHPNLVRQLEVFGSHGIDKSVGKVGSAICGKRVTAVVIKAAKNSQDIDVAYRRATAADPWISKILKQLYVYREVNEKYSYEKESSNETKNLSDCILCGQYLCPLCQLKNDFREILPSTHEGTAKLKDTILKDIIYDLIGYGPS